MKIMTNLIAVGLGLVLLPGLLFSQNNVISGTGVDDKIPVSSVQSADLPGQYESTAVDPVLINAALEQMDRAGKLTTAGLVLGGVGNFSVLYNAGTAAGREYSSQWPIVAVGMTSGITRLVLSFPTLGSLKKAETLLFDAFGAHNDENQYEDLLKHIRIAKNAATAVPFLAIGGIALVTASMVTAAIGNNSLSLWAVGCTFAIASYSATIVSSVHIAKAQKMLTNEVNSLRVGLNGSGIGLSYCF